MYDGEAAAAAERFAEWAPSVLAFHDRELHVHLLEAGALVLGGLGAAREAATVFGGSDALRADLGVPRTVADDAVMDELLAPARTALSEAEWAAAYTQGRHLGPEAAAELACAVSVEEAR